MTKLLVSVRDAWEAGEALAGGANVIDVKEPRLGSLGEATPETRSAVRSALLAAHSSPSGIGPANPSVSLSAALGELLAPDRTAMTLQLDAYAYAKVGLAGCGTVRDWEHRWQTWIAELPAATAPVAVIYADYRTADAPSPWSVLAAAIRTQVRILLVDTYDKTAGDLLRRISACELIEIIDAAHSEHFQVALAGSITLERLPEILRFHPDWVAVRGAVCQGTRESKLDRTRVKQFAEHLSTPRGVDASDTRNKMIDSAPGDT